MFGRLLAFPAGRRAKWAVLVGWILILVGIAPFAARFEQAQKNDPSSFLPGDAESLRALEASKQFRGGDATPAVVVYRRAAGLTPADRTRIARDARALRRQPPIATPSVAGPIFSRDGKAALVIANVVARNDFERLGNATDAIRARTSSGGDGLAVRVTGPAGFSTDAASVFKGINGKLLLATASLVFLLLILIYRSPIFWAIPLVSVFAAELAVRAAGYGVASAGVVVNGQVGGILSVLVFGAGTDYALLLVARYREELRRHEDKHEAMALALRQAGPAIVASGATVVTALLCLLLASLNTTAGLGPVGALGIALAVVSILTLLPALLVIAGRRVFWPFVPRYGSSAADETHGSWRRVGDTVARAPRRWWLGSLAVLAAMALGLLALNFDLTTANGFRSDVEAVQGQELVAKSFPGGADAPATVVVPDPARADAVRSALLGVAGVTSAGGVQRGAGGARFTVTFRPPPYSQEAYDLIPRLRGAARAAGGEGVLVGGPTAEERDVRAANVRDARVVVPVVLAVVLVILVLLLRALVAPLVLVGTVIASFAASLGVGALVFEHVFRFPGSDTSLPLYAFIFLVALGIDYNIFLMARVREEALVRGTREGMLRGLAVTGAVITSAGVVLAGTFATLAVLPLVALTELGFVVAFGVLLDTFLVRSVLVPALVLDLDRSTWWPSALARPERTPRSRQRRPSAQRS
ncbi:MAG TPA: MMPL family transporter [Gaiellaceae bacterium]|nr:MMPL family transporter [Gaiellaceae bacterium]